MSDETKPETKTQPEAQATRRTFLAMTVAGAAIASGAGGLSYLVRGRGELDSLEPPEPLSETGEVMARMLQERIGAMLKLPDATVAKWVNLYEKHRKPWTKKSLSRRDVQDFLLSTDFFPEADESRPLRFVAYYDPYVSICYYPLRDA